jgi:uncharacterized RDD family membrane protein YckC
MTQPPDWNVQPPAGPGANPPGSFPPPAPPPAPGYGYGYGAPATLPPGTYLDPESGLVLPQGLQLASIGRRIGAYFLSILLFIATLIIGYVIWGLIVWARGQTPALQVLGMRCWRPDSARPATFWWMALREIVGRLAEGVLGIVTLLVSFVLMVATKERRCLHDMIAGTVVVLDPGNVLGT